MLTKTVRSRFKIEIGGKVEGFTVVERYEIAPPNIAERRLGIYDYLVEVPPAAEKGRVSRNSAPARGSFTRSTPDEIAGVIRRLPSK